MTDQNAVLVRCEDQPPLTDGPIEQVRRARDASREAREELAHVALVIADGALAGYLPDAETAVRFRRADASAKYAHGVSKQALDRYDAAKAVSA